MKQLIVIIGPNGVGKSTTAKKIVEQCSKTAFVDSDWCRVMNPFEVTETTKQTITENIYCLLYNYLTCKDIDTVVFTYAWHGERKEIYDCVIDKLNNENIEFKENIIVLKCSKQENIDRAKKDGRDEVRIKRGIEKTFSFYDKYEYPCIDSTYMTPLEVANQIIAMIYHKQKADNKVFSKCGMRCDLCLIYRSNVEKEDRRIDICNAWRKIWQGFDPDPNTIICDGCSCESEEVVLFSPTCEARKCVFEKGLKHCGYCSQFPCDIFPAEPTKEETFHMIEVEKKWTWEDEKLMEAYTCKKNMDEFRKTNL